MTKPFGLTLVLAFLCSVTTVDAQTIIPNDSDARLVAEPSGARDDNNGGDTITGALVGVNTGGVDNYMVYEFSDLSAVAGQTISSATLEVSVATGFSHPQHGSDADVVTLSEIALPNAGWISGNGTITGGDTPANDGSISFLNRVQFNGGGTTEPWLDSGGSPVANLLGALTPVTTAPGWNSGSAPTVVSFTIDPATAQDWVDNGLGGLVMGVTDDGDSRSRFNVMVDGANLVLETESTVELVPSAITTTRGTFVSGGVPEISDSDNSDYRIQRNNGDTLSRTEFECAAITSILNPSAIDVTVEGGVFARSNVVQTIDAFDYDLGAWEQIDQRNAARSPSPDLVVTVSLTGDLSRFVDDASGEIAVRVNYTSDNRRQSFTSNTDQCIWTISN